MKIVYDITLLMGKMTGIENYVLGLVKKIDKEKGIFFYRTGLRSFLKRDLCNEISILKKNGYNLKKIFSVYLNWQMYIVPVVLHFIKGDIYHCFAGYLPKTRKKTIYNIYDCAFMEYPQYYSPEEIERQKYCLLRGVKYADVVISDSYSTKKDIIKHFGVSEDKIKVVHLAYSEIFYPRDRIESRKLIFNKYNIETDYVLMVGLHHPRKNLINLLRAYLGLKEQGKINEDLILIGEIRNQKNEIISLINDSKFKDNIKLINYVENEELPVWYSGATAFIFPSFYEGFGLPVVEAMACGVPIIASNQSSIPEIVESNGILFNPNHIDDMMSAIYNTLSDKELLEDLSKKSIERSKKFSLDNVYNETMKIYESVVKNEIH